jgi:hypothetical protein
MGQYYKPISIDKMTFLYSHDYGNGLKLMEHSYIGNSLVNTVESLLAPDGAWHKNSIVWAGDYADEEGDSTDNLYTQIGDDSIEPKNMEERSSGRYIVNHTKKEFVDKELLPSNKEGWKVHPLPLLTCEGNGRGGGDYRLDNEHIGTWARDQISIEKEAPEDYEQLIPHFIMDY